MDLTTSFYYLDEYCKSFEKELGKHILSSGKHKRVRSISLSLSEVMTIMVYYHRSGFKTFKDFYMRSQEIKSAFPTMPSYNRFIELQQRAMVPLVALAKSFGKRDCNGISFVDSFSLKVSHPKRISSHKVFRGLAARGKTSVGWFFGFKLHLVVNSKGEVINFSLTPGNVADNNSDLLHKLMSNTRGKVYADKGYLLNAELFKKLYLNGTHIVTKIRKNMKNILMDISDKMLLKKRGMIESVGAILKSSCNIEHSRYRSPIALLLNVCSGLMAYTFRKNKPSIREASWIIS